MKKSEIAKKLIQIVNNSDNNYDAYDDVLEHLEQSLPKEKVTKTKSNTVYITMSAGSIDGVYDSKEDMINHYRKDWGVEGTDDEVLEYLENIDSLAQGEWKYETGTHYKSIQVSEDNKLNVIVG